MSQERPRATSAIRSVPLGWSGRVITHAPPKRATAPAMRSSSVATITLAMPLAAAARR